MLHSPSVKLTAFAFPMGSFGSAHQTYWSLYSKYPGGQSRSASGSAAGGGNSEFGFGFGWATPQVGVRVQVRVQVWPSGCGLGGSNAIIVYNTGVLEILWRTKKDMHRMLLVAACFQFWELVAAVETKPQKDNTHQLEHHESRVIN